MLKMIKYMKPYWWMLLLIVALLATQAVCELALPSYTASIVDVGIQQQGVTSNTPLALRESALRELTAYMDEADAAAVRAAYAPLPAEEASRRGLSADEPIYALAEIDETAADRLEALFTDAFTLKAAAGLAGQSGDAAGYAASLSALLPEGATAAEALQGMPQAARKQALAALRAAVPESALSQMVNAAVLAEYSAIGYDLGPMQSQAIWGEGLKMLLVALLGALTAVVVGYFSARVSAALGCDLRSRVFQKVVNFSQSDMEKFSTASLITRSTNDVQQVQMVMVMLLRTLIYAPIMGVGGVLKALQTNGSMAWVIALGVALVVALVALLFALGMPRFKVMQTLIDKVNQVMRETLTGLPVIRAFCTQRREEERFDEASAKLMKTQLFVNRLMSVMMPMMMLIMNGIAVLILWTGAHGVQSGAMQVGDIMAYIQYTMQIIMSFLMISMMSVMLPRASVSAKRVEEVLATPLSITEKPQPLPFDERQRGVVELRDVSFRYPGAEEDMLHHISFTAKPGQTTAILGGTGSGKSTLINLVPRFYDVTEGQVLVDGVDVRDAGLAALRDRIGYVPQKGVLFSGTVEYNLTFGTPTIGHEAAAQAAEIAQAAHFIGEMDGGFDAEIAQGGTNVSGGQKQRLSIARAIAKHPEIYIFDDSFSALDFKTDLAVRAALAKATGDATILIVAQRISTVMRAEQIVVLDDGEVAGIGTHSQLMADCEVYRQIAQSQLSKEELDNARE